MESVQVVPGTWYKKLLQNKKIKITNNRQNLGNVQRLEQRQEIDRKLLSITPNFATVILKT